MQELPNLSELGHSEKDDLIRFLWSMLEGQVKWTPDLRQRFKLDTV